jgi:hypothetical protein
MLRVSTSYLRILQFNPLKQICLTFKNSPFHLNSVFMYVA